jgi:signal transduction histidine kinase
MICYLFPEPLYFFFSSNVPALLYYAQIPAMVIALILGFYIFWNGKQFLLNKLLLIISILFSVWTISTLIAWTNIHSDFIIFIWSFFNLILGLIAIFCTYFICVFIEKTDISIKLKIVFIALIAPILFLTPTSFNLTGFNITNCDAFHFEWLPLKIYATSLGFLAMIWILVLLIRKYRNASYDFKKQIILMGIGIEFFLFSFFGMEFLATYLTKIGVLVDSSLELYGLSGMVIFMIYISILTVRFGIFNIKLLATQALIWGLAILIGSQFFFIKVTTNFILNGITFVGIIVFGQFLIKSVKKEVAQREQLEDLSSKLEKSKFRLEESNLNLEKANDKLKDLDKLKTEFVSLASHQLRSPLTAIKGYTSMLLEGDYGDINPQAKETISRVMESSNNLTVVVEDLLNVSKIEQGGMKYVMSTFDFGDLVKNVSKELSISAEKKGLKLICSIADNVVYNINGDKDKLRQVVINLIDNSMKYTKQGQIEASMDTKDGKIILSIKDTGMGIDPKVKDSLFEKFSRGDGAKLNASGSGLGLYLVKEIVKAHHGRVWADSEGIGKGSTFSIELDEVK